MDEASARLRITTELPGLLKRWVRLGLLQALMTLAGAHAGAALAQSQPYPGPLPNQPPRPAGASKGAPIELKYYAPGAYQVSKLVGLLDNTNNTSTDINGQSFPCSDTTTATHPGNASNTHASTVPYDVWYPSSLGQDGLAHPIVVFGPGYIPPAGAPLPSSLPAGATINNTLPELVTADNASTYDYFLRHLASWGFVVIATQSGEAGSGLQEICAAKFMMGLNASVSPLVMVNEVNSIGPQTFGGIAYDPASGVTTAVPEPVPIPGTVPVVARDQQNHPMTFVFKLDDPNDPSYPIPQYSYAVGSVPSTYTIPNPFYGALNTGQIAALGQSEGATGAINAYVDGITSVAGVQTPIFKTLVSIETPGQEWCNGGVIEQLLGNLPPPQVIPEAPDDTCRSTMRLKSGSVFFVNGSLDWVVSPSWQLFPPCMDSQGNPREVSNYCMYQNVPASSGVAKVWATLRGANHQDITGQPWCINFTNRNWSQPPDAQYGANQSAIAFWAGNTPWGTATPFDPNILAAPATQAPCGADYSGDQSANPNFNNPSYGGVFGYLGYITAWLMDQLQGDADAHQAFVDGTGEIFSETTNWTNQMSTIAQ